MNLMDLFIKIGIKDEASGSIAKLSKAVGGGLKTAAKIGTAAVGAAGTALGALVKQSVRAYANYEQLVGGVETLFSNLDGTVSAAPKVLENASKAYKSAGLSANQYMETVTSFSAALISSLGNDYDEAARIADQTVVDMADNANKMGTSMDSLQAAYAGFAKQNYTMLDNLKLGYGGTKGEMERLLKDAEKLTGVKYDINHLDDVYEAIHVIQSEMGITGATAREANETIEGSFNALKASWQNLITGLGDPKADLGALFDNLVERGKIAFKNLLPVVKRSIKGIAQIIKEIVPMISEELPGLIAELLPELLPAAIELVTGIVSGIAQALPALLSVIWETVDNALSSSSFGESWANIKEMVAEAVAGIKENWDRLKEALQPLIDRVKEGWQNFSAWAKESGILQGAFDLLVVVINTVIAVVGGIAVAFESALSAGEKAAAWIKEKWQPVADFFSGIARTVESIFNVGPGAKGLDPYSDFDWSGLNFATGNDYIPYDNFRANLHRGEAVLTAREADAWRRGNGNGRQVVNNFTFNGVSQSDLDYIVGYVNRGLVSG